MNSRSSTVFRLFRPLLRPRGAATALVAAAAAAGLLTWLQLSVAIRLDRNSALASLLALELKRESAEDLSKAREMHVRLIQLAMARTQDPAMKLVSALRPDYSPVSAFMPAVQVLENRELESREALKKAQAVLESASKSWSRGQVKELRVSIWTHQSKSRISTAEYFLKQLEESAERLRADPSPRLAEDACMDNRFAAAMLLNAWPDLDQKRSRVLVKHFAAESGRTEKMIRELASSLPAKDGQRLDHYASNVAARAALVSRLNDGGIPAARELLLAGLTR